MKLAYSFPFPTKRIFTDNLVHASPSIMVLLTCCCRQGATSGDGERESGMCPTPLSGTCKDLLIVVDHSLPKRQG